MTRHNNLWVEKYRPSQFNEICFHKNIIDFLKHLITHNQLPHLFFYGPAGIGKTSTIISLAKEIFKNNYKHLTIHLNASDNRGVDFLKKEIIDFISTKGLFVKSPYKIVIMDEADSMPKESQLIIKEIIDSYGHIVRFCLIGNYQHCIIPELSSHTIKLLFLPLPKEYTIDIAQNILTKENIEFQTDALSHLYDITGGDLRKYINMLQSIHLRFNYIDIENIKTFFKQYEFNNIDYFIDLLCLEPFNLIQTFNQIKNHLMIHSQDFKWWMNKVSLCFIEQITDEKDLQIYIEQSSNIEYNCSLLINYDIQIYAFITLCKRFIHKLHHQKHHLTQGHV